MIFFTRINIILFNLLLRTINQLFMEVLQFNCDEQGNQLTWVLALFMKLTFGFFFKRSKFTLIERLLKFLMGILGDISRDQT